MKSSPVGVLLYNLGGPENLDAVEPFLVELFSDRDIIELPLGAWAQPIFARIIAKARLKAVKANYASIGGGSPQLRLTLEQAAALEACLRSRLGDVHVLPAMRYWGPSTEEALARLEKLGVEHVVTLPLYPHYSQATTGSSEKELDRVLATPRFSGRFRIKPVRSYANNPIYLDALADTVRQKLNELPVDVRERTVLFFSAHGLPQIFVDRGDPYVAETAATVQGVLDRLAVRNEHRIAYQSRTGPVTWIGPGTEDVLMELGAAGVRDVLMIPVSFVSEHIETLYEIDQLFADAAREARIEGYRRTQTLGTHPGFIEALATLVEGALARDD